MKVILLFLMITILINAQYTLPDLQTDIAIGKVTKLAVDDHFVYLAGDFTYIGANTGGGAMFRELSGKPDRSFPKINGGIYAMAPDGEGGWYIGGNFNKINDREIKYLAHIKADGTLNTAWIPNPDKEIFTLAAGTDFVYAGGNFTTIKGQPFKSLAKISKVSGSAIAGWNPNVNGFVLCLLLDGDTLYAGGGFIGIGGTTGVRRLAKINAVTGVPDLSWSTGADNAVLSITMFNDDLIVAGRFSQIGGLTRNRIAKLNKYTAAAVAGWNPAANGDVEVVCHEGNSLYTGGSFTQIGGANQANLARLDLNTGLADISWEPGIDSTVYAIKFSGNSLFIGGLFNTVNGDSIRKAAKLRISDFRADPYWRPDPAGEQPSSVRSFGIYGNDILMGGDFLSVCGAKRAGLGRVYKDSYRLDTLWNPVIDGKINFLVPFGNDLYAGGKFTKVNGLPRRNLVKVDLSGGDPDPSWDPSPDDEILDGVIDGNHLYICGLFDSIGGFSRQKAAKINIQTGTTDPDWNPVKTYLDYALAIEIQQDVVLMGGSFYNPTGHNYYMMKFDKFRGNRDTTFKTGLNGRVLIMRPTESDYYVAGYFNIASGLIRNRLAKINISTGDVDLDWNPSPDGNITSVTVHGSHIYATGSFTKMGVVSSPYAAKLNTFNGTPVPAFDFSPKFSDTVNDLIISGRDVIAGGQFRSVRDYQCFGFAVLRDYETGVKEEGILPVSNSLEQNYPNPFNPSTTISYSISRSERITLKIYDVMGREVSELVNAEKAPGNYTVKFDAAGLSSGVYFYTLRGENFSATKKLLLLR